MTYEEIEEKDPEEFAMRKKNKLGYRYPRCHSPPYPPSRRRSRAPAGGEAGAGMRRGALGPRRAGEPSVLVEPGSPRSS